MNNHMIATLAPDFQLLNHENITYSLAQVMGEQGTLLVFVGDIWNLGCIRTALWLQRQSYKLSMHRIQAAIIVPNFTYDLNNFFMSIPRKMPFPLLADPDREAYANYNIEESGFVLLNSKREICGMWHYKQGTVPHIRDVIVTISE